MGEVGLNLARLAQYGLGAATILLLPLRLTDV